MLEIPKLPGKPRPDSLNRLDNTTGQFVRTNIEKAREINENGAKVLRGRKL
jgi:hypothetical protein